MVHVCEEENSEALAPFPSDDCQGKDRVIALTFLAFIDGHISSLRLRRAVYRRVGVSTELISFLFLLLATTDKEQRNLASK